MTIAITDRLAKWIAGEGIQNRKGYSADVLSAHMLRQFGEANVTGWLDSGRTAWLRGACEDYIDEPDLTLGEWVTENALHGHLREDMRS